MKAIIFTNDDRPECRSFLEIGSSLESDGYEVEYLVTDDERYSTLSDIYDIFNPPAIVITADNGSFIDYWQGNVPLYSDVRSRISNG